MTTDRDATNPFPDLDLQVGDVLLIQDRLWRITRFTPKRAYCELAVDGLGLTAGLTYSHVAVNGSSRTGHFIDNIDFTMRREAIRDLIKIRGQSDDVIRQRAAAAVEAMRQHKDEVLRLRELIKEAQALEVAARDRALSAAG